MTGCSGPKFFENPAFLLQQSRTAFRKPFSAQLPAKLETPGCPGDLAGGGGGGHGGEGRGDRGGCCEQGCGAWSSWDSLAPRWILDRQELIGVASRDTFWKSFMQTLHFGRIWFPEIRVQPHLLSLRAGKCISVHCTANFGQHCKVSIDTYWPHYCRTFVQSVTSKLNAADCFGKLLSNSVYLDLVDCQLSSSQQH